MSLEKPSGTSAPTGAAWGQSPPSSSLTTQLVDEMEENNWIIDFQEAVLKQPDDDDSGFSLVTVDPKAVMRRDMTLNIDAAAAGGRRQQPPAADLNTPVVGGPSNLEEPFSFGSAPAVGQQQQLEEEVTEISLPVLTVSPEAQLSFENQWGDLVVQPSLAAAEGFPEPEEIPAEAAAANSWAAAQPAAAGVLRLQLNGGDHKEEHGGGEMMSTPVVESLLGDGSNLLRWIVDETIAPNSAFPELDDPIDERPAAAATVTSGALGQEQQQPKVIQVTPDDVSALEPFRKIVVKEEDLVTLDSSVICGQPVKVEEPPVKRRRGRPSRTTPLAITPRVPRTSRAGRSSRREDASSSEADMTEEEANNLRYRRMRDLNNEASKRCRQNRKRKFADMEEERELLLQKNRSLQTAVEQLEGQVKRLKALIINGVANPSQAVGEARRNAVINGGGGAAMEVDDIFTGEGLSMKNLWHV